jgi:hypothetical protein
MVNGRVMRLDVGAMSSRSIPFKRSSWDVNVVKSRPANKARLVRERREGCSEGAPSQSLHCQASLQAAEPVDSAVYRSSYRSYTEFRTTSFGRVMQFSSLRNRKQWRWSWSSCGPQVWHRQGSRRQQGVEKREVDCVQYSICTTRTRRLWRSLKEVGYYT